MKKLIAILLLVTSVNLFATEPSPAPQPDKLHDAMSEFVVQITKTLTDAKEFTTSQAPEVLSQYLSWQAYSCQMWIYFQLVVAIAFLVIAILMWLEPDETGGVALGATVLFVIMVAFAVSNMLEIKKIKIAPKVYAIDYAKSLVK